MISKQDFHRYCRLLHGWLSAVAFLALWFFSVTGYRSLTLELGTARRFAQELLPTEEGGGLRVSFDHY